mmetsp:Transcript_12530/g.45057  ORF Transcript_12530/g.45057 Transcript_12530/m.45057 type:complete len:285 (+) Transcript_12530:1518-2372(+)
MSSARSLIAGRSSCESKSTPMTWFTWSSFAMMFRRTSGNSSLRSVRKMGKSCSIVWSFPIVGASPMMTLASAARTCCDPSDASSFTLGMIFSPAAAAPTSAQNDDTPPALAILTSASPSISSCSYDGNNSSRAISAPMLSHSSYSCCATMYRTRHDLSAANFFTTGTTSATHSSLGKIFPSFAQSSTANNRTESCSSVVSCLNNVMISPRTCSGSISPANAPRCCAAARLVIGVSSAHSCAYVFRRSLLTPASATFLYATANIPHALTRAVNQSPFARRCTHGT